MRIKTLYPYAFDWGKFTAEAYDSRGNEVTIIFNCDLRNDKNIDNTIQYAIGRLCWGVFNFPPATSLRVVFDIRGQEIIVTKSKKFKEKFIAIVAKLEIDNMMMIEFIR
jgi:hypothetical protein